MTAVGGTLLFCLFLLSPLLIYGNDNGDPIVYHVGDDTGWASGINWPHPGQTFLAGDVLLFKYPAGEQNVVRVDVEGYKTCTVPVNPEIYGTGADLVKLNQGDNYFICGAPGHCTDGGMKIVVTTE